MQTAHGAQYKKNKQSTQKMGSVQFPQAMSDSL